MIGALHGVFLAYLAGVLAWNARAARGRWRLLLAVQALLTLLLVADRVRTGAASLLFTPGLAAAFPALALAGLAQNVAVMARRGARLGDVPVVIGNAGLCIVLGTAAAAASGWTIGPRLQPLLYSYALVQGLVGSHLALSSTLNWHVPLLLREERADTLAGLALGLLPAAFMAFVALLLVVFQSEAERVLLRFDAEPRLSSSARVPPAGVWTAAGGSARPAPGALAALELPADFVEVPGDGEERPRIVALHAPASWLWSRPSPEEAVATFIEAAERAARTLRPALLLPFPEPDGEAPLALGTGRTPEEWRAAYQAAAARIRAASPTTRVGLRLAGAGPASRAIYDALHDVVDVAGPRLQPGSASAGGPAFADAQLAAWSDWRLSSPQPPELWILGGGLSPIAYGVEAQARWIEGLLARAARDPSVAGLLLHAWEDRGSTQGLLDARDAPRPAARVLERLLPAR